MYLGTFRFGKWEKLEKSPFRIEVLRYCTGFTYYVHKCPFLKLEWFTSPPAFGFTNLLPDSCQNFPYWLSDRNFSDPCWDWRAAFFGLAFSRLTSLLYCHWLLLLPDPPTTASILIGCQRPFVMAKGGSWGFDKGRLGRRTANAQACLLEWGLVGHGAGRGGTGRDSRHGAGSVGAEGGAADTGWSKSWGLRRLSRSLPLLASSTAGEGSQGPRRAWPRAAGVATPVQRLGSGVGWGAGGLDAARRTRCPGRAASGLGIWWALQAWLPAEPLRNLLLIFLLGSFGERLLASVRRTPPPPSRASSESKAAVQPPTLNWDCRGTLGQDGPGTPGLVRGCSAESPGGGRRGRRGGEGGDSFPGAERSSRLVSTWASLKDPAEQVLGS